MVFVLRRLTDHAPSLGERLRALRRTQAISLESLQKSTRIQKKYLEALEWGSYDELPEPLYTRNFIRTYVRALQADESYFLELYEEEVRSVDLLAPHRLPRVRARRMDFFVISKLAGSFFAICAVVMALGYVGWQLTRVITPPDIVLETPADHLTTTDALLEVRGTVDMHDAFLTVNGERAVIADDGSFLAVVDLTEGPNTIRVEARRRYSPPTIFSRTVVFSPSSLVSQEQGISTLANVW